MFQQSGVVNSSISAPHIYIIIKRYCLYIGETQKHPVLRWGAHLGKTGTFMNRLKEADLDVWSSYENIFFLSFNCQKVASLPTEEQRVVSQYIEHKIHEKCILSLPKLHPVEIIISDTTRTAPSRCRHSWANTLAMDIFNEVVFNVQKKRMSI